MAGRGILFGLVIIVLLYIYWNYKRRQNESFIVPPISPCETISPTQQSYVVAECTMYRNMFQPLYNTLTDSAAQNAFINLYNTYAFSKSGQTYIDTYDVIIGKFIGFHKAIFEFIGNYNISLPAEYDFTVPAAIRVSEYGPGIATWEEANATGNAYKCVKYNTAEKKVLSDLQVLTGVLENTQLVSAAKENICASKGYFIGNDKQSCGSCDGCCMPYVKPVGGSGSDVAEEVVPKVQCPKPKVRPFQIPPRQIRLRVVPPKVKKLAECFQDSAEFHRDISQMIKSSKFEQLQQFPFY